LFVPFSRLLPGKSLQKLLIGQALTGQESRR
jgi:hypothetical protein